jgi:DNA-binding transcriptional LysR family regulator
MHLHIKWKNQEMANLSDYRAFVAVIECGNLSAAARHLRRSVQAVSRTLAALEREVGVELIKRTTRRASPSDAGRTFYDLIKKALTDIDQAHTELVPHGARVEGTLRVGCSTQFTPVYVVPVVANFMKEYPDVNVELVINDHHADMVEDGLDVAVRLGALSQNSLKARQLGSLRQIVCGAPSYFQEFGRPQTPADLARHACVVRLSSPEPTRWLFQHDGEHYQAEIRGRFSANNFAACNAAVINGLGIGLSPHWLLRDALELGQVEEVLTQFHAPRMPVFITWPPSAKLPARTRAFIDFLALSWAGDSFIWDSADGRTRSGQ